MRLLRCFGWGVYAFMNLNAFALWFDLHLVTCGISLHGLLRFRDCRVSVLQSFLNHCSTIKEHIMGMHREI